MGASFSIGELTDGLARCDKDVLKHVLGQPASTIKAIFQAFESERQRRAAEGAGDEGTSPHSVMEDARDFSRLFGSGNRHMKYWTVLFNILDDGQSGKVDFFEAIATLVRV
eukprot:g1490.t1